MAKERMIGTAAVAASELKRVADPRRRRARCSKHEGLDGASLRAIAAAAGYTPAALYFHFDSKEAIYAEVLRGSLVDLEDRRSAARSPARRTPAARLRAAAMAFFRHYDDNPRDLDLGFYLFRGGMKPHGLGKRARRGRSTPRWKLALHPIAEAAMRARRRGATQARLLVADVFAHAAGLLLLDPYRPHPDVRRLGAADLMRALRRRRDRLAAPARTAVTVSPCRINPCRRPELGRRAVPDLHDAPDG